MRATRRRGRGFAVCMGLALGALGAALPQGAVAAGAPPLAWEDCGDGYQCATLEVPRDYAKPGAETFELALIRRPAADPASRIGSLFVNPGGPGGSGVDFVRATGASLFATLNQRFDIVGWDPRGVGATTPAVDCRVNQELDGPFAQPFARPFAPSEDALVARAQAYAARCAALNPGFLPFITTADAARDLDMLREAVGDEELSYLGFSYGTYLGATYATLFPGRARALVLDGALDADDYANRPIENVRAQTAGFEVALGRFFQACAGDQATCGFGGSDPWLAYDRLAARLDAAPIPAPGADNPAPVDGDDLRAATILTLYSKQSWPLLARTLATAEAGDGTLVRLLVDAFYGREPDDTFSPGTDQFVAISGVDSRWPSDPATYLQFGRDSFDLFDHFWWNNGYGDLPFGLWPAEPANAYYGPFANQDDTPALVVGTTYDPATPYKGAVALTAQLGNARLLTMEGDGHTAYGGNSACIDAAVEGYLVGQVVPPAGTTCTQEVPFAAPEVQAAAAEASRVAVAARLLRWRVGGR